jgi:hypothetical protein
MSSRYNYTDCVRNFSGERSDIVDIYQRLDRTCAGIDVLSGNDLVAVASLPLDYFTDKATAAQVVAFIEANPHSNAWAASSPTLSMTVIDNRPGYLGRITILAPDLSAIWGKVPSSPNAEAS